MSLFKQKFNILKCFFNKNSLFLWVYLLSVSLNVWFAHDKNIAFSYYKFLSLTSILIFFTFRSEINRENIEKIFYIYCICAAVVSLIGFAEMFFGRNLIYEHFRGNFFYPRFIENRMMSTFMHPNVLGCCLIAVFPSAYYFYKTSKSTKLKLLNFSILFFICAGIVLTFSRGTWIAFLFMMTIWFLAKRKIKLILVPWLIFVLFSIIASMPFAGYGLKVRFGMSYLLDYFKHSHRTMQYFISYNMLNAHPFAGIGLNHYRMLFDQYTNTDVFCRVMGYSAYLGRYIISRLIYEIKIPDSIYLMHLAETGIIGFLGLIVFLVMVLSNGVKKYNGASADFKALLFALIIGFIGILFNMASFDGFLWKAPFYLFWIFAGVLAG